MVTIPVLTHGAARFVRRFLIRMLPLFALNVLAHLARHLLQVSGRFIEAPSTKLLNGFREVAETRMSVALWIGVLILAVSRRPFVLLARWGRSWGRLIRGLCPSSGDRQNKSSRTREKHG
jgi:hypothetical protein